MKLSFIKNVQFRNLLLYTRTRAVFSRCEDVAKDRNTRDHLAWITGNGGPMHEACILHRLPRAWNQQI